MIDEIQDRVKDFCEMNLICPEDQLSFLVYVITTLEAEILLY
jgi:hypothetical protein